MLDVGDKVMVLQEETTNTIKIYGCGIIDEVITYPELIWEETYPLYVVKLLDSGYVFETDKVIDLEYWSEYLDSRPKQVIKVDYEA